MVHFVVIQSLLIRLPQMSAHAIAAEMLCHVQNFVAITVWELGWADIESVSNLKCHTMDNRWWNMLLDQYWRKCWCWSRFNGKWVFGNWCTPALLVNGLYLSMDDTRIIIILSYILIPYLIRCKLNIIWEWQFPHIVKNEARKKKMIILQVKFSKAFSSMKNLLLICSADMTNFEPGFLKSLNLWYLAKYILILDVHTRGKCKLVLHDIMNDLCIKRLIDIVHTWSRCFCDSNINRISYITPPITEQVTSIYLKQNVYHYFVCGICRFSRCIE